MKVNNKALIIFGIVIIIFGFFVIFGDYLKSKKRQVYDIMYLTNQEEPAYNDATTPNETPVINDTTVNNNSGNSNLPNYSNSYDYIGRIEIPKIRLIKGFCDKNSVNNDVSKNIKVMETSKYPDVENGNFILVAHAGNAWNSFFGQLYKLSNGDKAYVYYGGKKYTYTIVKQYIVDKTGYVKIYRDRNKTTMTLITCTQNYMKTKQTVYILELINVEYE